MSGRLFELHRDRDVTGVSGCGAVADGVEFPDDTVVIRWRGSRGSTVVWATIADAVAVHGHDGATRVVWLDDLPEFACPSCGATIRARMADRPPADTRQV
jgi:hypothetical protein